MAGLSGFVHDITSTIRWRGKLMPWIKGLDEKAPRAGDIAPDFTLSDATGTNSVTLSDYRSKRPVVLFFGSYT